MWTLPSCSTAVLQSSLLSQPAGHSLAEVVPAFSSPASDHEGSSSVACSPGGHRDSVGHLTQGQGTQSRLLVYVGLGLDLLVDVGLRGDLLVDVGHDLGGSGGRGDHNEKDLHSETDCEWEVGGDEERLLTRDCMVGVSVRARAGLGATRTTNNYLYLINLITDRDRHKERERGRRVTRKIRNIKNISQLKLVTLIVWRNNI